jgi:hypothetical protein
MAALLDALLAEQAMLEEWLAEVDEPDPPLAASISTSLEATRRARQALSLVKT